MRRGPHARLEDRIREWSVDVERIEDTGRALVAFGSRGDQPVVLKVQKEFSDEWRAGEVLRAFGGIGTVRVFEHSPGATLLECLSPATPLSDLCRRSEDEHATAILAEVMRNLSLAGIPNGAPSAEQWGGSFDRFITSGSAAIPRALVQRASQVYLELCQSQSEPRLLHGDLHYDNVLFDATRGWIAVDPKGVVGEVAFEAGAAIRNPTGMPELFTDPPTIDSRIQRFARGLDADRGRVAGWAFAQAVLAAIWLFEDGESVGPEHPWLELARALRERLPAPSL